jgi:hypothetical protein
VGGGGDEYVVAEEAMKEELKLFLVSNPFALRRRTAPNRANISQPKSITKVASSECKQGKVRNQLATVSVFDSGGAHR